MANVKNQSLESDKAITSFNSECLLTLLSLFPLYYRYLPPVGVVPQVEAAQPRKIRVLPTIANGGAGGGADVCPVPAAKLRPTDNGLALQKVGTLHVPANRKLTELQLAKPPPQETEESVAGAAMVEGASDTRSPTPDYPESNSGKRNSRPRSKKSQKAPTAPNTPGTSAKSTETSHHNHHEQQSQQPSSQGKRGKLKLFKTKSDPKRSESDRLRARSMEYLRTDVSEDMQEVRRRHSREDLSGDESLLAVTKNGPVTVFSSQKKLDDSGDDWEEMPRISHKAEEGGQQQPKQFYFGMTPGDVAVATAPPPPALDLDEESRRVMEEFDAVLSETRTKSEEDPLELELSQPGRIRRKSSRSGKPSPPLPPPPPYTDDDEDEESQDIALNLRPTLPKKPQQLPRFSPSAAWRALGQQPDYNRKLDSSKASDMSAMDLSDEEDDEDVMEERISKNARPVAPHPPRHINEKSADSGISGDAGSPDAAMGPGGRDVKPLAMSSPVPQQQQQQQHWTPQQDLLDDSSSEAEVTLSPKSKHPVNGVGGTPPKIMPKSQMFNDSTDTPGSSISGRHNNRGRKYRKRSENQPEAPQKYNSLRKLKRSVSGAFATAFRRGGSKSPEESSSLDDGNWVLSRSAPNSVVNGSVGESSLRKLHRSEADLLHQAQFQQQVLQQGGAGLLIHQYPAYSQPVLTQRIVYLPQYDSRPGRHNHHQYRMPQDTHQAELMRRAKSADALYLEAQHQGLQRRISNPVKKFSFQSTVRMQEKRALEQRLSREAELKERKRLQEIQAMQRVEEEFQRKRAREKANIRQQLRILQHAEHNGNSNDARLDPEGAPSSISHNRTSSDEIQQAKIAVRSHQQPEPRRSQAAVFRRSSPEEQPQSKKIGKPESLQQDYRREAIISSSRTRSAAPPPPPSFQTHPERNNNMNHNNNIKKPSNIYKRLAEIASEEESISSPPPVPSVLVVSSNGKSSASPVRSNGAISSSGYVPSRPRNHNNVPPPPANNNASPSKVMTQELSEYRQERREYRDYRSPRIATQPGI